MVGAFRGGRECELQTTGGRVRGVDNLRVDEWARARLGQWHRQRQQQDDARGQVNEVRYRLMEPRHNTTATVAVTIHTGSYRTEE